MFPPPLERTTVILNSLRARRRIGVPVVAIAAVALLASCAASTDEAASSQDVIFALKEDPTCIDPQQVTVTTGLNVARQLVDSLLDQDPKTGELVPWLAESWTANDDLTSFDFTLRDGVTFSDGTELTADVVAANFDAAMQLGASASLVAQYLAGYTATTVNDESSFTVDFSAPNAQFLQGASTITLGIVSAETTTETPEARCQSIVGSGAFVLESYVQNDSLEIVKRTGYDWGSELRGHTGEAYADSITFPIITENGVRTGGLTSGEFDVIQDLPYIDESRFATDDYALYAAANPGVPNSLIANTSTGVLAEEAVRKAVMIGLDRGEINELTGSASGQAPTSVLTSTTPGYTSQAKAMEFDRDGAIDLLEEAGWVEGADGIREKAGQKLTATVTGFYAQDVLEAAQIQLKEIGFDLQLNMVTPGDFFGAIASGSYEFLGAGLTRTDPDVLRVLLSQEASSHWAIVDDAELEALLAEQATTADADARQAIIDDIQALVVDKAYVIPTLETIQLHASSSSVSGIVFDSASRVNLFDMKLS
ncbi:ABC transporter substrate-binding protein [Salinibacterium hongtaonis]|uniref:ABC transporter substrate-binding protein n=1 Tax=Homoserinimonas hongtaonis TaxID=2079791 RepID=A0A2U1SZ90_9MICO|nr:ABC transporter substrate-binding protein [Salinibacterium hongtaonis]